MFDLRRMFRVQNTRVWAANRLETEKGKLLKKTEVPWKNYGLVRGILKIWYFV